MQSGYDYSSSLSSASQDNRPFNILREAIFELVQKLFSLQDEKMVMGGCSILKVRAAVNILNTVVSRKYAPPLLPFCNLSLSTKRRGGGGGLYAGYDNFSRDYALPSDKA